MDIFLKFFFCDSAPYFFHEERFPGFLLKALVKKHGTIKIKENANHCTSFLLAITPV